MKNSSLAGTILTLALVFAAGFYRSGTSTGLPDNAPEGVLEYLQSADEQTWIALYPDRLEVESPGPLGGHSEVDIEDIKSFRKWGGKVIVNTKKGQITFDLTGISSSATARKFVNTLEELMAEEK